MDIEAVVFDMDGVLLDSFEAWCATEIEMVSRWLNKKIEKEEYKRDIFGKHPIDILKSAGVTDKNEIEKRVDEHDKKFLMNLGKIKVFPEAKFVLQTLKKNNIRLAVLSNNKKQVVEAILKKFSLLSFFDQIVGIEYETKPYLKVC